MGKKEILNGQKTETSEEIKERAHCFLLNGIWAYTAAYGASEFHSRSKKVLRPANETSHMHGSLHPCMESA